MTDREWTGISVVLEEAFRHPSGSPWTTRRKAVYRSMLDRYEAAQVEAAIHKITGAGKPWLPAVAEIVAAIEHDPSIPTWPEVSAALFGSASERRRADGMHPALEAFVGHLGGPVEVSRIPVHCPDRGHWEVKRLESAWAAHVEAWVDRSHHRAALLATSTHPRQLSPISTLGLTTGASK